MTDISIQTERKHAPRLMLATTSLYTITMPDLDAFPPTLYQRKSCYLFVVIAIVGGEMTDHVPKVSGITPSEQTTLLRKHHSQHRQKAWLQLQYFANDGLLWLTGRPP